LGCRNCFLLDSRDHGSFRCGNLWWVKSCQKPDHKGGLVTKVALADIRASDTYSYLSDSIGSSFAAFHAGHSPKIMPMPTLAKKPAIGAHRGTYDGMIIFTSSVSSQPIPNPIKPPNPVSVIASIKN